MLISNNTEGILGGGKTWKYISLQILLLQELILQSPLKPEEFISAYSSIPIFIKLAT